MLKARLVAASLAAALLPFLAGHPGDATAVDESAGAGVAKFDLDYALPLPATGCVQDTWADRPGLNVAFVAAGPAGSAGVAGTGYFAGGTTMSVTITAGGCDGAAAGSGTMSVSMAGSTVGTALNCALSGSYSRTYDVMTWSLSGSCSANGGAPQPTTMTFTGVWHGAGSGAQYAGEVVAKYVRIP